MKKYLAIIIILFTSLLAEEEHFAVSSFGLPVADLVLQRVDSVYEDIDIEILRYSVRTIGVTDWIFSINNSYEFFIRKKDRKIVFHKKKIQQINVIQTYSERICRDKIYYSTGDSMVCPELFTHPLVLIFDDRFFSTEKLPKYVQIEGEVFRGHFDIDKSRDDINENSVARRLDLEYIRGEAVTKITDIFSWKISDPEAGKYAVYDKESGELITAFLKFGSMTVKAVKK